MLASLDLATQTGLCWGTGAAVPVLESIQIAGADEGQFFSFYRRWLLDRLNHIHDQCERGETLWVGFEAPILPMGRIDPKTRKFQPAKMSIMSRRKLFGLASYTAQICYDLARDENWRIECREASNSTLKKLLAGKGTADKLDMDIYARRLGMVPRCHDEADAFAGWLNLMQFYAKPFWPRWHQLLLSSRSGPLERLMIDQALAA